MREQKEERTLRTELTGAQFEDASEQLFNTVGAVITDGEEQDTGIGKRYRLTHEAKAVTLVLEAENMFDGSRCKTRYFVECDANNMAAFILAQQLAR